MTGLALAQEIAPEARFLVGAESDCYDARRNCVALTHRTAHGDSSTSLLFAAHEAFHARQALAHPWCFRWPWTWCVPVRIWLEIDAWLRAFAAVDRLV